jgi:hypothetical protein
MIEFQELAFGTAPTGFVHKRALALIPFPDGALDVVWNVPSV